MKQLLILIIILGFSQLANAKLGTTKEKLEFAKKAISDILSKRYPDLTLISGSLKLRNNPTFNTWFALTDWLYPGEVDSQNVSFFVRDKNNNISRGWVIVHSCATKGWFGCIDLAQDADYVCVKEDTGVFGEEYYLFLSNNSNPNWTGWDQKGIKGKHLNLNLTKPLINFDPSLLKNNKSCE